MRCIVSNKVSFEMVGKLFTFDGLTLLRLLFFSLKIVGCEWHLWLQESQRCHVKDILLQQVSIENIPCFEFLRKGTFLCTSLCNSNRFLLQAISGLAWICHGLALVPTEKNYVLYHHQQVSLHSLKNVTNVFEKNTNPILYGCRHQTPNSN